MWVCVGKKSVDGGYVLGVEWVWEYAMEKGRGIFPVISQVSEVDIEEEAVKGKKQNCACYIVSSANCNFYEG